MLKALVAAFVAAAPAASPPAAAAPSTTAPAGVPSGAQAIALPGGAPAVDMDYLAADRGSGRIWVPAGNTGKVDVIDVATGAVKSIEGFATLEKEMRGKKRTVGPSSASVGEGVVYVGSRADSNVCVIDAKTLVKGACVKLETPPDGVCWVSTTKEVWVTTPHNKSLTVLDAHEPGKLKKVAELPLDGEPEGYAVDPVRGLFFTNFEDQDQTVTFDVKTRKEAARWPSGCGSEGGRGLAEDVGEQVLFVACPDRVISQDLKEKGKAITQLSTGAGLDNIDYLEGQHRLYAAAGKAGKLTIAHSAHGLMILERSLDSAQGGRVVVVDGLGGAYVADSANGRVLHYAASAAPDPKAPPAR